MTWLVWRRYRLTMGVTLAMLVALALWMAWQVHTFDVARQSPGCVFGGAGCAISSNRFFSLNVEVSLANLVLLALPCALGAVFGVPLVASELEHRTNRLVWTQGMSRTRWLLTKWVLLLVALGAVTTVLTVVSQWWSGHVTQSNLLLHVIAPGQDGSRLLPRSPESSPRPTRCSPSAWARPSELWSGGRDGRSATVVLYGAIAVFMAQVVRPNLEPELFGRPSTCRPATPFQASRRTISRALSAPADSWDLGPGYRYAPGWQGNETRSAGAVAQGCWNHSVFGSGPPAPAPAPTERRASPVAWFSTTCRRGSSTRALDHYWPLQWRESAILLCASALCLGGTVIAVRRWRA